MPGALLASSWEGVAGPWPACRTPRNSQTSSERPPAAVGLAVRGSVPTAAARAGVGVRGRLAAAFSASSWRWGPEPLHELAAPPETRACRCAAPRTPDTGCSSPQLRAPTTVSALDTGPLPGAFRRRFLPACGSPSHARKSQCSRAWQTFPKCDTRGTGGERTCSEAAPARREALSPEGPGRSGARGSGRAPLPGSPRGQDAVGAHARC